MDPYVQKVRRSLAKAASLNRLDLFEGEPP